MSNFTPLNAFVGGLLIGAAATLLLWLNGRIAGVSNIANGLIGWKRGDILWRLLFLAGLVAGAALYYGLFDSIPVARQNFSGWLLAAGGMLVGLGTSFGGGCTSGHGVCGLGRLSLRSLYATVIFVLAGIITTFVVRHLFGIY